MAKNGLTAGLGTMRPCGRQLQLDLLIADGGTYADAYDSRYAVPHEDLELWLVALEQLIQMKRESDRPIDRQDIERLR